MTNATESALAALRTAIIRSVLSRYSVYVVNVLSVMVLARAFAPEAHGEVAALMVVYLFFQVLAEGGVAPAVINLRELPAADRDGIFTVVGAVSSICGLALWLMSQKIASFYGLPRLAEIMPFFALAVSVLGFSVLTSAFLVRDQRFRDLAVAGLCSEVISTACACVALQYLAPSRALATKILASTLTSTALLYVFSRTTSFGRPRLGSKIKAILPLLGFSSYQLGFNIVNYAARNLDNVLVGKYYGLAQLAIYDQAYKLMRYPLMLLTFAMVPAIQPVVTIHREDLRMVESIHTRFASKLSFAGAFAGLGLFLFARPAVLVLLGDQWIQAIPIVKILAICVPLQVVLSSSGSFFQALGRADILFLSGVLSSSVLLVAFAIGIVAGSLQSLAWSIVVAFSLNFVQAYLLLHTKIFGRGFSIFIRAVWPVWASMALMLALWQI